MVDSADKPRGKIQLPARPKDETGSRASDAGDEAGLRRRPPVRSSGLRRNGPNPGAVPAAMREAREKPDESRGGFRRDERAGARENPRGDSRGPGRSDSRGDFRGGERRPYAGRSDSDQRGPRPPRDHERSGPRPESRGVTGRSDARFGNAERRPQRENREWAARSEGPGAQANARGGARDDARGDTGRRPPFAGRGQQERGASAGGRDYGAGRERNPSSSGRNPSASERNPSASGQGRAYPSRGEKPGGFGRDSGDKPRWGGDRSDRSGAERGNARDEFRGRSREAAQEGGRGSYRDDNRGGASRSPQRDSGRPFEQRQSGERAAGARAYQPRGDSARPERPEGRETPHWSAKRDGAVQQAPRGERKERATGSKFEARTRAQVKPDGGSTREHSGESHAPDAASEGVRVSKLMSARGLCSRREADEYISKGLVRVDGVPVKELGARAHPDAKITLEQAAQKHQQARVTILLNKPMGYVSGQPEPEYTPAVTLIAADTQMRGDDDAHFNPVMLRGLAPAGRLDIDSTGLLVLTQDGRIAKQLVGDNSEVEKEYLVRVEGTLSDVDLRLLNHGLSLDDRELRPAQVEWENEDQLRFVLREGRKRQIRRMCELVGLRVVGLKRVRIGKVRLGRLPLGMWRLLGPDETF